MMRLNASMTRCQSTLKLQRLFTSASLPNELRLGILNYYLLPQWNARRGFRCSRRTWSSNATAHLEAKIGARKPYYVTTPIFYVNAEPHIGHLHSLVLTDVLKRYQSFKDGQDAPPPIMLTGTDEHGAKIQKAAEAKGCEPKDLCDQVSVRFKELADAAHVDYDVFFRTTEERHAKAVQHAWRELDRNGYIYKAQYEGWYSVSDETYYPETQVRDDVDASGERIKVSTDSGQVVEWMQEENYMFRLSAFQPRLVQWLEDNPQAVRPQSRYNEVLSYLKTGNIGDLSISRPRSRLQWGIQVPDDPSHTIYVWLDALTNYATAAGYPQLGGSSPWPADVHVIGKDIIRFHAVYWPAILMALDLPLPRTILAHAHWTMGNMKMSKSRGNVVNPFSAMDQYSADGIRYFLMSKGGLDSDSDFSEEHVERDYRKDLAGQTGNLLQRLQSKNLQKKLGQAIEAYQRQGTSAIAGSDELWESVEQLPEHVDNAMRDLEPSRALNGINDTLAQVNAFVASTEPWKVTESEQLAKILPPVVSGLHKAALLLQPFIPTSARTILNHLGLPADARTWKHAINGDILTTMKQFEEQTKGAGKSKPVFSALQQQKKPVQK